MESFLATRIRPWGLLAAVGTLAVAGTVAGYLAPVGWVFDLAVNFHVQYFVTLAVASALFLFGRRYHSAGGFGAVALINLALIVPLYFGGSPASAPTGRAVLLNVHTENRRFDLVRKFILSEQPDFVVFEEINDEWLVELSKLTDYPYILSAPRPDNFGIALFSRWPMQNAEIKEIGDAGVPSVVAQVRTHQQPLTVIGTHPLPPDSPENFAFRNGQLQALANLVRQQTGPVLVLGDLNVTPWSPHFRKLVNTTGLRDAARGRGLMTTWPVPVLPLRIPIDHCLVSASIAVSNLRVGPDVGSDHFPVIVDIGSRK